MGLVVLTALSILYAGLSFMRGKKMFASDRTYHTIYEESQGIVAANPVLLKGTVVGRVESVKMLPDQDYKVLVTFTVNQKVQLTKATKARLVTKGLLGPKAIDLIIKAGEPLPSRNHVPGEAELSFKQTLPALSDAKNIPLLVNQFVTKLVENTDKINSIFDDLKVSTQELKKVVVNNQRQLHAISKNMVQVSAALSDEDHGVKPLMRKLNRVSDGIEGQEVHEAIQKLNQILSHTEKLLRQASAPDSSVNKLLQDDVLHTNLNQVLVDLDHLLVDLKKHPQKYVSFSIFGANRHKKVGSK